MLYQLQWNKCIQYRCATANDERGRWFPTRSRAKRTTRENPSWTGLINNNYINSENQTRPESGINPLSPNPNSF